MDETTVSARTTPAVAVVLSFAAGATDTFAFLQLGGIFTANMTGNLILVGLYQRPHYATTLIGATVAVLVFALVAGPLAGALAIAIDPLLGAALPLAPSVVALGLLARFSVSSAPTRR